CAPLGVFWRFQPIATTSGIPFPVSTVFIQPTTGQLTTPDTDVRLLTAFVGPPHMRIEGTLRLFRGQTSRDQRPKRALRPQMYRIRLTTYADVDLLCSIAEDGVVPRWRDQDSHTGVRHVPRLSKEQRSPVAGVLLYPRDVPFERICSGSQEGHPAQRDGRTSHDLSAPRGASVNGTTGT
ncbi:hypothetical protein JG688_00011446, partial [Phytophthora aleatoria]